MSAEKYGSIADEAAVKYGIPVPIFRGLIAKESSWNPNALGTSGDTGLTQLTPAIYKYLNVNPWNPRENLFGGAKFLSELYGKYGNWGDALSHYNAGFNLSNGRGYSEDVLKRAGKLGYTQADINGISGAMNKSPTPILDAKKNGGDVVGAAGTAPTEADKLTWLQEKMQEFFDYFKKKFGIKLVLGVTIILLLYLSITRLVK